MTTLHAQQLDAILNSRSKRLTGEAYKLAQGQIGMDVILPEMLDIDESRMAVWLPFADGNRRDGVGDLLEVGGIRTERHRANPIVLFDHGKQISLPVGLAEDPDSKQYTVVIDPVTRTARAKAFFYQGRGMAGVEPGQEYDHAVFCEQLFDLLCKRYIRAGSIGYQVVKALELSPDREMGVPKGLHLLVTLMLECSAVVLPANMDTVRKALDLSSICGKPLSPYLVKSLEPYAPERTAQLGYEGKNLQGLSTKARVVADRIKKQTGRDVWTMTLSEFGSAIDPTNSRWRIGMDDSEVYEEIVRRATDLSKSPPLNVLKQFAGKPWADSEIRYQQSKKSLDHKAIRASVETTSNFEPGQQVVARSHLHFTDRATRRLETFARPGERVRVLDVQGDLLTIGRADGLTMQTTPASVRKPSKNVKALSDIRKKYRPVKRLRVRHRKSKPGASFLYVSNKDLKKVKQAAEQRGVKFQWMGSHKSREKIKLIGDDGSIDELAKLFAIPLRGVKSLRVAIKAIPFDRNQFRGDVRRILQSAHGVTVKQATKEQLKNAVQQAAVAIMGHFDDMDQFKRDVQDAVRDMFKGKSLGDKSMAGKIKYKVKQVPEEELDNEVPADDDLVDDVVDGEEDASDEPFGAQCLRRIHEDLRILMQDYDEMMGPLEHEGVKGHLQKTLEGIEQSLTEVESLWEKHYAELPPLEGAGEEGEEGEEEPEEEAEAEPEEDVEDKDVDSESTAPVGADSAEMEEPTPDEAYEASQEDDRDFKALSGRKLKEVRGKYGKKVKSRKKAMPGEQRAEFWIESSAVNQFEKDRWNLDLSTISGPKPVPGRKDRLLVIVEGSPQAIAEIKKRYMKSLQGKKAMCPDCGEEPCVCTGEVDTKDTGYDNELSNTDLPPADFKPGVGAKDLDDNERSTVGEAAGFLGEVGQPNSSFEEEHRFKSYHYHKVMDAIGNVAGSSSMGGDDDAVPGEEEDLNGKRLKNSKTKSHDPNEIHEDVPEELREDDLPYSRKMCKECSGFFKELAFTKNFGDPHRQKAMTYHQKLTELVGNEGEDIEEVSPDDTDGVEVDNMAADGGDHVSEPGELDEKLLRQAFEKQNKDIADLSRKLAGLRLN